MLRRHAELAEALRFLGRSADARREAQAGTLRYLLARRKQAFISVISLISTLGVTVGVIQSVDGAPLRAKN